MAKLTGQTIAASYDQLLIVDDANGISSSLQAIESADTGGSASALQIATNKALVKPGSDDANAFEVQQAGGTAVLTVNTSTVGATLIGALTVGADDAGHDVIFYGNTASSNMTWDTSEDDLVLNDSRLYINQDDNVDSIVVDTEATSAHGLTIAGDALTTGSAGVFSTSSTALASTATGGLVEISSTGDTDTNVNNLLYIKNDHADSTGTTALKIQQDSTGPAIDAGAGYMVNEQGRQDYVSNTMPQPYYRFDGSDDYIATGTNKWTANDPASFAIWVYPIGSSEMVLFNTNANSDIFIDENEKVQFRATTSNYIYSSGTVTRDAWNHIVCTQTSSARAIYINGVLQSLTDVSSGHTTAFHNATAASYVGYVGNNSHGYMDGQISDVKFFNNALSAAEVKELYSGASVPFKYKGASQTELLTGDDADWGSDQETVSGFNGAYVWATTGSMTDARVDVSTNVLTLTDTPNGHGIGYPAILESGKRYRFTFNVTSITNTWEVSYQDSETLISGTGQKSIEFTAGSTELRLWAKATASEIVIDQSGGSMTLTQIGAVAEYDGSGITNDKWYDKSGNESHGTVFGATDENTAGAPVISANHPAFLARPSGSQTEIANSGVVDVVLGAEVFDQGDNFASNTFTAPVTGKYQLNATATLVDLRTDAAYYEFRIITSNRNYESAIIDPDAFDSTVPYWHLSVSVLADMDASDTAKVAIVQSGGTASTDINTNTHFSGFLVC